MTAFWLGINSCFAVKRWPRPPDWAAVVRDELGVDLVQHCADLVDIEPGPADLERQAAGLRDGCAAAGLTLHSTFTAYSANLLLHPDRERRVRARNWYQRMIDFTAAAGAQSTGGHVGAFSAADWRGPPPPAGAWGGLRGAPGLPPPAAPPPAPTRPVGGKQSAARAGAPNRVGVCLQCPR